MADSRRRVRVRVLGPFECTVDGEPVSITGRLRTLLAVLAMSAQRPVPFDRLSDGIWGEEPPAEPRRALQVYVNRLRGRLGADTITTDHSGYRLEIDPDDVDALRFERLAERVTASRDLLERRRCVENAMDTWGGQPFEAVAAEPLHQVEAPRLLQRWLGLVETGFDLRSTDGGDTDGMESRIVELDALTRQYPLREPLWERLLTALSAAGRGAEALERYEDIRSRLADELGTDPGPGLQSVYAKLLDTGGVETPVPRQLPPDMPQFTGRDDVMRTLDELLAGSSNGSPVVAVTGTGGTGKTALAMRWAHRNTDRFPDGQLFVDLHGFSSQDPVSAAKALEQVLRSLGVAAEVIPRDTTERTALLRTLLSDKRTLIVLDNARDEDQIRPLLPGGPCAVLITSRNQLRGLVARDGVRPVALDPFDEDEALALLRRTIGERVEREPDSVAEIVALCGRLPLAVAISAERAVRIPGTSLAELAEELRDEHQRLSHLAVGGDERSDLRAVFELSYQLLDADTASVFRLLGTLPDGAFGVDSVAALTGRERADVAHAMDGLVAIHMLSQLTVDTYRLHDLVRAYAAQLCAKDDGEGVADAAVSRACTWLLGNLDAAVTAVRPGQPKLAPSHGVMPVSAGPDPAGPDTFAEAIAWFREWNSALVGWLRRASERGLHDYVWRLQSQLSLLLELTEQREEAASLAALATEAADAVDDPVAKYVAYQCAGRAYARSRRFEEADVALTVAFESARAVSHRCAEAGVLAAMGVARRLSGEPTASLRLQRQALERAAEPDESLLEVSESGIRMNIGGCHYQLRHFEEAITSTRVALDRAREVEDRWSEALCLNNLTVMQEAAGDYGVADQAFHEVVRLCDRLGAPALAFNAQTAKGRMLASHGEAERAVAVWEHALTLVPLDSPQRAEVLGLIRAASG